MASLNVGRGAEVSAGGSRRFYSFIPADHSTTVKVEERDLLLIDRHEQEVFGENVHVASPRLHPLVPRVTVTEDT